MDYTHSNFTEYRKNVEHFTIGKNERNIFKFLSNANNG